MTTPKQPKPKKPKSKSVSNQAPKKTAPWMLGNKFWEARSSHGRKPIFATPDDLWAACLEYFEWNQQNPLFKVEAFAYQGVVTQEPIPLMRAMTVGGLCIFIDIDRTTWDEYRKREGFTNIITRAEEVIRDQKFAGAAAGLLQHNIIARDLGLKDQTSTEHTGDPDRPVVVKEEYSASSALKRTRDLLGQFAEASNDGNSSSQS